MGGQVGLAFFYIQAVLGHGRTMAGYPAKPAAL